MYSKAHAITAAGIVAVCGFLFGLYPITLFVCVLFAPFLGTLPDVDIKLATQHGLGIKHRGPTHGLSFVFIITLLVSVMIVYVMAYLELLLETTLLTGIYVTSYEHIFFPAFGFMEFLLGPFLFIFICMFGAILSHLLLDVSTKSGLHFGDIKLDGVMKANGFGNLFFIGIGFIMLLIGLGGSFIRYLDMSDFVQTILYIGVYISIFLTIFIVVLSVVMKYRRNQTDVFCGTINGMDFCGTEPCFTFDGKKYCFRDSDSQ